MASPDLYARCLADADRIRQLEVGSAVADIAMHDLLTQLGAMLVDRPVQPFTSDPEVLRQVLPLGYELRVLTTVLKLFYGACRRRDDPNYAHHGQ